MYLSIFLLHLLFEITMQFTDKTHYFWLLILPLCNNKLITQVLHPQYATWPTQQGASNIWGGVILCVYLYSMAPNACNLSNIIILNTGVGYHD